MVSTSKNFILCLLLVTSSFMNASSHDHSSMGHESHSSITETTVSDMNLPDAQETGHEHHMPVEVDHSHHHHTGHQGMMDHGQHPQTATTASQQEQDVTTETGLAGNHGPHHHHPSTGDHQDHHHPPPSDSGHHDHHGPGPEKQMDMMMDQASSSVVDNRLSKKDEDKYKEYVEIVPDSHDGHEGHGDHDGEHGGHDGGHGGQDGGHGGHMGNVSGHDMGMMMYFRAGVDVTILFEQWHVKDVAGMIGSVIGIIILATFYEGLKYFREYLFKQYVSSMQFSTVAVTGESGRVTQVHKVQRHRILSFAHMIQTCLHVIQMVISYFLMLIFMTYNVWLCLAVIIGAGIGYFVFGWKKATVVDITEHCH